MLLFLDTANINEIRHAVRLGVVGGVTTNPSLIAKEGKGDYRQVIREIAGIVQGPISVEVLGQEAGGMIEEARTLASWAPQVVVKVPITEAGLEAASVLSRDGVKCNLTLCFSVNQAMLAANVGAAYVSPFVGRLDDVGQDGMVMVKETVDIYRRYGVTTQVIAASIRHPLHCVAAAQAGADVATVPYKVLLQMVQHPLTDLGVARFLEDWRKLSLRQS